MLFVAVIVKTFFFFLISWYFCVLRFLTKIKGEKKYFISQDVDLLCVD